VKEQCTPLSGCKIVISVPKFGPTISVYNNVSDVHAAIFTRVSIENYGSRFPSQRIGVAHQ
jgi:hypothetical protein